MLKVAIFIGPRLKPPDQGTFQQNGVHGGVRECVGTMTFASCCEASPTEERMTRVHKSVRSRVRPGPSRIRRMKALGRRTRLEHGAQLPDLSDLILYGQG
jgi:hypothetical protein